MRAEICSVVQTVRNAENGIVEPGSNPGCAKFLFPISENYEYILTICRFKVYSNYADI